MPRSGLIAAVALVCLTGSANAQSNMPQFQHWLNGQMSQAMRNYHEGVRIYNSVPRNQRLDYKCAHGDRRACWLHQQQLNNANRYMSQHYRNLGHY